MQEKDSSAGKQAGDASKEAPAPGKSTEKQDEAVRSMLQFFADPAAEPSPTSPVGSAAVATDDGGARAEDGGEPSAKGQAQEGKEELEKEAVEGKDKSNVPYRTSLQ